MSTEKDKKHLSIDLEFLDKDDPINEVTVVKEVDPAAPQTSSKPSKFPYSGIFIYLGIVVATILICLYGLITTDDKQPSPTSPPGKLKTWDEEMKSNPPPAPVTPPSDERNITVGEYDCPWRLLDEINALEPNESEKQQLNFLESQLQNQQNILDQLGREIDGTSVNEYSPQWQIDQYNSKVNEYNSRRAIFQRDYANYETRLNSYNAQVDRYNSYLQNNCTKRY